LQREQTTGLVSEAQFFRNSGQLAAARQSSRRALEIDPSNYGAQQLLKSIQHEMQAESLSAAEEVSAPAAAPAVAQAVIPPPPPVQVRVPAPPPPPPPLTVDEDLPEMILPEETHATAPVVAEPAPIVAAPVVVPPPPAPMPARTVVPPPPPAPSTLSIAPAAAALLKTAAQPNGPDTPSPSATQRFRPSLASGGAAAAIAAAVAAAKARQVEEEKQHRENTPDEEPTVTPIKATPLVVSTPPVSRVVPSPQPTASLKRGDNGSSVFLTDDPLVVKRPATAVMTQRMKSTSDATAAVATPPPAPPTRLPGTRAIPISVSRASSNGNGNGTETVQPPSSVPAFNESRRPSENLPMRRPPSDVYAKGKRRGSSAIFAEKEKKSFPWAIVGFVLVVGLAVTALIMFAWSAPKMANTPTLQPDKLTFTWKAGTPKPQEEILRLKGGQSSASFSASSSDEEWLTVTPVSDEPTNRSWQVTVDPEKVGPTGPNGTSGWIDVVSTEGFKTQEEVILKVTSADPGSGRAKKSPAAALVPPSAPPSATSTSTKAPAAKPVVKKPAPDVVGINN